MKKIENGSCRLKSRFGINLTFFCLFAFAFSLAAYSQTVSLQLASAPGVYINNYTDANIKFRRSPYGTPDNVLTGLTVTRPAGNTIGNYDISGFTTFEIVKLFINNVEQIWWGTKFVGNPNNSFVKLTGNETIAGMKTFSGIVIAMYPYISTGSPLFTNYNHAEFFGSTLIWKDYANAIYGRLYYNNHWFGSNAFYYPYIHSSSPLYTNYNHAEFFGSTLIWKDYANAIYGRLGTSNTWTGTNNFQAGLFAGNVSFEQNVYGQNYELETNSDLYLRLIQPQNNTLIWKREADSTYGIKNWWKDGFKMRMLPGYKWYGVNSTTPPIKINESQFIYDENISGLTIRSSVLLNIDSTSSRRYTNYIDSTWMNMGEPVSKYRMITLGKKFWGNPSGYLDWKWYYKSVSEGGTTLAVDSAIVINTGEGSVGWQYNQQTRAEDNWKNIDTIILPERGTYSISYHAELIFPVAVVSGITARDTVQFRMLREFDSFESGVSNLTLWKDFYTFRAYDPESNPVGRTFILFSQYSGSRWLLQIRADLNSSGETAKVAKPLITYILIK